MIENDTEPNLLHGIITYIKGKDTIPFSDIIDIKWTIPNITDYRSNWLGWFHGNENTNINLKNINRTLLDN